MHASVSDFAYAETLYQWPGGASAYFNDAAPYATGNGFPTGSANPYLYGDVPGGHVTAFDIFSRHGRGGLPPGIGNDSQIQWSLNATAAWYHGARYDAPGTKWGTMGLHYWPAVANGTSVGPCAQYDGRRGVRFYGLEVDNFWPRDALPLTGSSA
jgi:hypothetical protein